VTQPKDDRPGLDFAGLITGAIERGRNVADAVPGARFAREQARKTEEKILRRLKRRLDALEGNHNPHARSGSDSSPAPGNSALSPADRLQQLMDQSLNQKPETAQQALYAQIVQQLLPDEVRILASLSDGGSIAFCHVDASNRLGTRRTRALSYASRLGIESGVMLTDSVSYYIGHLCELGLMEIGPEDPAQATKYEMIENDSQVRQVCERIDGESGSRPRITRYTAGLSPLGLQLWQACHERAAEAL